jgi:hypothetical protein
MKLLIGLIAIPLLAQTTVYLSNGTYGPVRVTNAVSNSGTIRLTANSHGFSVNDKIMVQGVRGCAHANGTRTVSNVVDANTVDLLGRDGVIALDCENAWIAPSPTFISAGGSDAFAKKLVAYTLKAPPNIDGFDGPAGTFSASMAGKAVGGNPPYDAMVTKMTSIIASDPAYDDLHTAVAGLLWYATGTSSYLAYAKRWVNALNILANSPGCDEQNPGASAICGKTGGVSYIDQISTQLYDGALAFDLIQGQMTTQEKQNYANWMLGDYPRNNTSETSCDNAYQSGAATGGTLTATAGGGANYVTISPASATSVLQVGYLIDWRSNGTGSVIDGGYVITNVNSNTGVVTLNHTLVTADNVSTTAWFYDPWYNTTYANICGYVWEEKHYSYNGPFVGEAAGTGLGPYPKLGGTVGYPTMNLSLWRLRFYIEVGAATCNFDVRGCMLFEEAETWFYDQVQVYAKNLFSGITNAGGGTYRGRVDMPLALISLTLKSGLTPSLDLTGGNWLTNGLAFWLYQLLPTNSGHMLFTYGGRADNWLTAYQSAFAAAYIGATPSATMAAYARWHLTHKWDLYIASGANGLNGDGPGYAITSAKFFFMYVDPAATVTDYTAAVNPNYFFGDMDSHANWRGTASSGTNTGLIGFESRTGWASTDTGLFSAPVGIFQDHTDYKHLGHYQIYKGNWLLANTPYGGASMYSCTDVNDISCWNSPDEGDFMIEVGRAASTTATSYSSLTSGTPLLTGWTTVPLYGTQNVIYAGTHPYGPASNTYTYFAFDSTLKLTASLNVSFQRYHTMHIKKGGRDYILRYVTTTTQSAPMRTYLHYPNNGESTEGNTTSDANGVIYTTTNAGTSMHSVVILPATLAQTDFHIVRTSATVLTINPNASASYPVRLQEGGASCSWTASDTATLNGFAGNAYIWVKLSDCTVHFGISSGVTLTAGLTLDTQAFPTSDYYPVAVWNSTGAAWNTQGYVQSAMPHNYVSYERRFEVDLGTATSSEFMVLHNPHADQVSSAPTTRLATTAAGWRTVEINAAASLPAVAAFRTGSACKSSWTATTTHSGTAQYVIAGLCPGNYHPVKDGVDQANVLIGSGDESLTFDGASGNWSLSYLGSSPAVSSKISGGAALKGSGSVR